MGPEVQELENKLSKFVANAIGANAIVAAVFKNSRLSFIMIFILLLFDGINICIA